MASPYLDEGFCQSCCKVRYNVDNSRGVCEDCERYNSEQHEKFMKFMEEKKEVV